MPSLKIAVCVPCYGDPKAMFMQSLFDATKHFMNAKLTNADGEVFDKEIELFLVRSSMLTESRHRLVAEAVAWGADYMLWADADHVFPANAICKLWSRGLAVVGCNYARRCNPTAPTAAKIVTDDKDKDHKNLVYTTREKADEGLVEEVSHLGFGLCLINMRVFDVLQLKAEEAGEKTFLPLFMFTPTESYLGMIGEDVYFFKKLRDAGIPVYLDHEVSWEVGHINENIVMNAHAVAQEQKWLAQSKKLAERFEERAKELEKEAAE